MRDKLRTFNIQQSAILIINNDQIICFHMYNRSIENCWEIKTSNEKLMTIRVRERINCVVKTLVKPNIFVKCNTNRGSNSLFCGFCLNVILFIDLSKHTICEHSWEWFFIQQSSAISNMIHMSDTYILQFNYIFLWILFKFYYVLLLQLQCDVYVILIYAMIIRELIFIIFDWKKNYENKIKRKIKIIPIFSNSNKITFPQSEYILTNQSKHEWTCISCHLEKSRWILNELV